MSHLKKTENVIAVKKGSSIETDISFYDLTAKGYIFDGWYNEKQIKLDKSYKVEKDETFTAKWSPIKYTIKFDKNNGKGTDIRNMICEYDKEYSIPKNTFSPPVGYKSTDGWSTSTTQENSLIYADEEKIKNLCNTDGQEITLYAIYSEGDFIATFVDLSNKLIEKVSCTENEVIQSDKIPKILSYTSETTKDGKVIKGWYDITWRKS